MTVQQFIEKAIEGGWTKERYNHENAYFGGSDTFQSMHYIKGMEITAVPVSAILLDPEAWKAVGKVDRWKSLEDADWQTNGWDDILPEWHLKMRAMIDALCEGKTISQFLETL